MLKDEAINSDDPDNRRQSPNSHKHNALSTLCHAILMLLTRTFDSDMDPWLSTFVVAGSGASVVVFVQYAALG